MNRDGDDLARVQRWMQAVITHPLGITAGIDSPEARQEIAIDGAELEQLILPSRALSAADRLAVYGNAYFARLLECLRELFPALRFVLGDEAFDALAFAYLQRHPSTSYSLGNLAAHWVSFLEETRPRGDAEEPGDWSELVVDLARLEWTIDDVFDGPGEEGSPSPIAEQLAALAGAACESTRLQVSKSLRLLELRFPLNDFYSAARRGEACDWPSPGPSCLVVWRRNYVVRRWEISPVEFGLLSELAGGAALSEALERASRSCDDPADYFAQVPVWFREWGGAGVIVGVDGERKFGSVRA